MTFHVITHNNIIGFHCWHNAPAEYAYLRSPHRHVFSIRCRFHVSHTDRQIEINEMQDMIEGRIKAKFTKEGYVNFASMSCEDIARYCIEEFGCEECEVLEDGFGGAYARK